MIVVVSNDNILYLSQAAEEFSIIFERNEQNAEIELLAGFTHSISIDLVLGQLEETRLRIFIGMFGPSDARSVLCRVRSTVPLSSVLAYICSNYSIVEKYTLEGYIFKYIRGISVR